MAPEATRAPPRAGRGAELRLEARKAAAPFFGYPCSCLSAERPIATGSNCADGVSSLPRRVIVLEHSFYNQTGTSRTG